MHPQDTANIDEYLTENIKLIVIQKALLKMVLKPIKTRYIIVIVVVDILS